MAPNPAEPMDRAPSKTASTAAWHRRLCNAFKTAESWARSRLRKRGVELSARKGRVLFDAFFVGSAKDSSIVLDVDSTRVDPLIRHLTQYKMRSKVAVEALGPNWTVWAGTTAAVSATRGMDGEDGMYMDPRDPTLTRGFAELEAMPESFHMGVECEYQLERLARGLPEGQTGSSSDFAHAPTPLECNLDLLKGVAFNKGCYLGQELTARTHHVGIVRKRLVPFKAKAAGGQSISVGDDVLGPSEEKIGVVTSWTAPLGMARVKIAPAFPKGYGESDSLSIRDDPVTAWIPPWFSLSE